MRDMTYDGHATPIRTSEPKSSLGASHHPEDLCLRDGQQRLSSAVPGAPAHSCSSTPRTRPPRLLELVAEGTGPLEAVVTTHQHWDHHRALPRSSGPPARRPSCGADDAAGLPLPPDRTGRPGRPGTVRRGGARRRPPARSHPRVDRAGLRRPRRAHRTCSPATRSSPAASATPRTTGQSFDSLIEDVTTRVFDVYDDDTWVYPGHGADTTLGAERPHLQEWRDRGW